LTFKQGDTGAIIGFELIRAQGDTVQALRTE
jgi:hypothetical protein